ncbi:hypothetical protein, partial [Bacillus pumilus]|uniref:hypothetical protein n=1 Tax=Bacillus pumilus TaxID=1408 RepID=UPI003917304E
TILKGALISHLNLTTIKSKILLLKEYNEEFNLCRQDFQDKIKIDVAWNFHLNNTPITSVLL